MIWLLLIPIALVLCLGSWLSYAHKTAGWYVPVFVAIQVALGLLWCWASRTLDARTLYSFGLVWDVLTVAAYSVLPLVLCGVRLSPVAWCGFGLVLIGAVVCKFT